MSAQVNFKLDPALKKELDAVLNELGLSLSSVTRAFYKQLIRNRRVDFYLDEENDTPKNLTGEQLEKDLIENGYSKKDAKAERKAYEHMREEEKAGRLIEM